MIPHLRVFTLRAGGTIVFGCCDPGELDRLGGVARDGASETWRRVRDVLPDFHDQQGVAVGIDSRTRRT